MVHWKKTDRWYGVSVGFFKTEMGAALKTFQIANQQTIVRTYNERLPYYQLPVFFNYYAHPQIMFGVGGYYASAAGNAVSDGNINDTFTFYSSQEFGKAGYKTNDYGIALQAHGKLNFDERWFGALNLMYLWGLQNISTNGAGTVSNSSLLTQVGIGYSF